MAIRRNYEFGQVLTCLAGAVALLLFGVEELIPGIVAYAGAGLMAVLSLCYLKPANKQLGFQLRLVALPQAWMTHAEFSRKISRNEKKIWLGAGFPWGRQEVQNFYSLTQRQDKDQILEQAKRRLAWLVFFARHPAVCLFHPVQAYRRFCAFRQALNARKGDPFMQGLCEGEDIWLDRANFSQNVLVVGSTGSGKTRVFDALTAQAINAKDCTVIFDPKGDPGLRRNLMLSAKAAGREDRVVVIDLANPESSPGYNPLADLTQQPSRAGSLIGESMPASGNNRAFRDFGIQVMSTAAEGLVLQGKALTLRNIRRAIEDRQRFAVEVLKAYLSGSSSAASVSAGLSESAGIERQLSALVELYRSAGVYKPEVDAVIELGQHNAEHFSKMITSTILHLQRLTNGAIGDLLSPETPARRSFFDARKVRERNLIVCLALGALLDKTTCSVVGSLVLASLVTLAGGIYSYSKKEGEKSYSKKEGEKSYSKKEGAKVTLVVDEASEMMSEPFLQLLAQGRAAGFNTILATQTVADFDAREKGDGMRVLANVNNVIALRCNDPDTQKFLSEKFGRTVIRVITQSQGIRREAGELMAQGGSLSAHEIEKDVYFVSPVHLSSLPDCEFFAMVQGGKLFKCRMAIIVEKASDYKGE